jgi:hypothetical protein
MAMTFRRFSKKVPVVSIAGNVEPARRFADLRFNVSSSHVDFVLMDSEQAVVRRIPCPEARLLPLVESEGATAKIHIPDFASPLETIVAATKSLHVAKVDPTVKWLVGRLELPMPFHARPFDLITIRIAHRLPRLSTLSEIFCNGTKVGAIMFNVLR